MRRWTAQGWDTDPRRPVTAPRRFHTYLGARRWVRRRFRHGAAAKGERHAKVW